MTTPPPAVQQPIPDSVTIPGFLDGKPFKPKVYLDDAVAYDKAMEALAAAKTLKVTDFIGPKTAFLKAVLARSLPEGQPMEMGMDLRTANDAFAAIWAYAFRLRPLG